MTRSNLSTYFPESRKLTIGFGPPKIQPVLSLLHDYALRRKLAQNSGYNFLDVMACETLIALVHHQVVSSSNGETKQLGVKGTHLHELVASDPPAGDA